MWWLVWYRYEAPVFHTNRHWTLHWTVEYISYTNTHWTLIHFTSQTRFRRGSVQFYMCISVCCIFYYLLSIWMEYYFDASYRYHTRHYIFSFDVHDEITCQNKCFNNKLPLQWKFIKEFPTVVALSYSSPKKINVNFNYEIQIEIKSIFPLLQTIIFLNYLISKKIKQ